MIFLNPQTFCYHTWFDDASLWATVLYWNISLLSSRSRSQWGLIWSDSKYVSFCYIYLLDCWSVCNQTWFYGILLSGVQVRKKKGMLCSRSRSQWNLKISKNVCQDIIFWTAESFSFITKLGTVMRHHVPEYHAKRLLAVFEVKVTFKTYIVYELYIIKLWLLLYLLNYWSFCSQSLVWWYIIISWVVLLNDCISVLCSKSRPQQMFKILLNFHLDHVIPTAELVVTKLCMVMHHHGPECHVKRFVCYHQGQGHSVS